MSDLESLLLVLGVLYVSECVVWVPLGAVSLSAWLDKQWRMRFPGGWTGNSRGGLLMANPLPPLGSVFVCPSWPISISPISIYGYTAASVGPSGRAKQTGLFIPFESLNKITTDGKGIYANGQLLCKTTSHAMAGTWAEAIRRLKALPQTQRVREIQKLLSESLDGKEIFRRLGSAEEKRESLRRLGNMLFACLFVVTPVILWRYGFGLLGLVLLLALYGQSMTLGFLFRRAHKVLYPNGSADCFVPFLTVLLSPPAAIRAHDLLGRHLLENFHPLAVASVLCSPEVFKDFARALWLDLHYPILPVCPSELPAAMATEEWFRNTCRASVESFLRGKKCKPEEWMRPPAALESCNRSYCPRCLAQYTTLEGNCMDCGGRALKPL